MTLEPRFHPKARRELRDQALYYDDQSPGLGARFLQEVERGLDFISSFPSAATIRHARGVRGKTIRTFPFTIIYFLEANADGEAGRIQVLAIAHHKRRTGYWRDRLS